MTGAYCADFEATKQRFQSWWNCETLDRPLLRVIANGRDGKMVPVPPYQEIKDLYIDSCQVSGYYRNYCESHHFLAEAYPVTKSSIGPGSMALYLGGEPTFSESTVWYQEMVEDCREFDKLQFDPENKWWKFHQDMVRRLVEQSKGDYLVNIPDIIENLDILSALRGSQNLCYDLLDYPDEIERAVKFLDSVYFSYYDPFYEMCKCEDGTSSFTCVNVLGKGKTGKIQCDFSAMISPDSFREFVQPSVRRQCQGLDYSIYHLDGPDAVVHTDALMEIKELKALQWIYGAGQPDGANEYWYDKVYDKVRGAGKALWIGITDGGPKEWRAGAEKIIQRYGTGGIFLNFPEFPDLKTAQEFIASF